MNEVRVRPNEGLITALKDALKHAESGDLQGMAAVAMWQGGDTSHWWRLNHLRWNQASHVVGEMHCAMTALSNNTDGIYKDLDDLKGR